VRQSLTEERIIRDMVGREWRIVTPPGKKPIQEGHFRQNADEVSNWNVWHPDAIDPNDSCHRPSMFMLRINRSVLLFMGSGPTELANEPIWTKLRKKYSRQSWFASAKSLDLSTVPQSH